VVILEDISLKGLAFLGLVMIGVFIFKSRKIVMHENLAGVTAFCHNFGMCSTACFSTLHTKNEVLDHTCTTCVLGISVVLAKLMGRIHLAPVCVWLCV